MLPGFISRPGLVYPGDAAISFVGSETTNSNSSTTYTFTAEPIGAADADRIVVVAVSIFNGATVSGLTIGGVAATKVGDDSAPWHFAARVPTGTTADIVVTIGSGTASSCVIGVYRLTGIASLTPYTSATVNRSGSGTSDVSTVHIPQGGVAIASNSRVGNIGVTWTNATEAFDVEPDGNEARASAYVTAGNARNLTITAAYSSSTFANMNTVVFR